MKRIIFTLLCISSLANVSATVYEKLYIVGNATTAGWNPGAAIEMTKTESGVFVRTGALTHNPEQQARFKFIVAREWHPSITCRLDVNGHLLVNPGEEYDLYERPTGLEGYDNAFQVPSDGTYKVDVNLNTMKIICTRVGEIPDRAFTRETFITSEGETLNYRKLTPLPAEEGAKYPLVIFLHGAGERGSDNSSQLKHGSDMFVKTAHRTTFPAYVLFPQCPVQYFWAYDPPPSNYDASNFPVDYPIAPANRQVKELIDSYLEMDAIDKDRIYILGLSMGGMATFDLACRFPGIFAAAVPICGGVNTERLNSSVKNINWRIFHGDSDGTVPVKNSRDANSKLVETGANVEYMEFPGVDHDSWVAAFMREDFLPWIFSKTRSSSNRIDAAANKTLKIYCYNNKLYVEAEEAGTVQINLYSVSGTLIYTFADTAATVRKEFSLPPLSKGIYIAKALRNGEHYALRICI